MKKVNAIEIRSKLVTVLSDIGYTTESSMKESLKNAYANETKEITKDILSQLLENIHISNERDFPLCQDTGLVVFWVKLGNELLISEGSLNKIINEAVEEAYVINNYRHSVVVDPIDRINTKSNTPAIIHYEFYDGNDLEISVMLKGGGSENMSALKMLKPSEGIQGIRNFVIETVKKSGGNACPPLLVGVGIGGNFETCALLAKKSLFRMHNEVNNSFYWQSEEKFLLQEINKLGIGPMGLGGRTTAVKVNIEVKPCHIASLPVAVNLECHAHRLAKIVF